MDDLFTQLEDREKFFSFIGGRLRAVQHELGDYIACTITLDEKKLQLAHADYIRNLANLTETIESRDPDHYKRSGALLHALNVNRPIANVHLMSDFDYKDMDQEPVPESALHEQRFSTFYEKYSNEFSAFSTSYSICCLYEETGRKPAWEYWETICAYLNNVRDAPVDSYFILFKSLMQFI